MIETADQKNARAMREMRRALERVRERVFKPGVKLTMLMRDPTDPEVCMVVSNDPDLHAAAAVITREADRAGEVG